MIGYAESRVFSPRDADAFRFARALVGRVSSSLDGAGLEVRCHELARAVAHHLVTHGFEARVVDGMLWSIEHTWIILPGKDRESVLDVYTPGRLPQVQLLDAHSSVSRGYEAGRFIPDLREAAIGELIRQMSIPAMAFLGGHRGRPTLPTDRILDVDTLALSTLGPDGVGGEVPAGSRVLVRASSRPIGSYGAVRFAVLSGLSFRIDELRVGDSLVAGGGLPADLFAPDSRLARAWLLLPNWAGPKDDVVVSVTHLGDEIAGNPPASFAARLDITGNILLIDPEVATPVVPGSSAAQAQARFRSRPGSSSSSSSSSFSCSSLSSKERLP